MNTELEDRLTERLQGLTDQMPVPAVSPEDDLARGRRSARARRTGGLAAAVAVGVVMGGGRYLLHAERTGRAVIAPASSGAASPSPQDSPSGRVIQQDKIKKHSRPFTYDVRLTGFRAALAEVLDPAGRHLDAKVSNEQSMGGAQIGTKLGWKVGDGLGEIMVSVSRPNVEDGGFNDFDPSGCVPRAGAPCTPVTLADGTTGTTQTSNGELAVFYTRSDKQLVLIVETRLFGNNSTVPIHTLPATAPQLLRAAADPRMTLDR